MEKLIPKNQVLRILLNYFWLVQHKRLLFSIQSCDSYGANIAMLAYSGTLLHPLMEGPAMQSDFSSGF